MLRRTLDSNPGLPKDIGFYFAGLEEVREQLRAAVGEMSADQIGRQIVPGAHSIAALLLHIGEAEWYWMRCVISGDKVTDEIRNSAFWDVLETPESFVQKNYSAEFCLNEVKRIREQTRQTLTAFDDSKLDTVFTRERRGETEELSLRWILHHLIDHEAQHKGQILMLKRLLG